jgi:ADP-ribosylglycohydrolase
MTIATAEAIIAWHAGGDTLPAELWRAYRAWRRTCDHGRAPGVTCLGATAYETPGTIERPRNSSKGCGGVMRIAPLGVALGTDRAFDLGVEAAAMTHGHPLGYLPAGVLAAWVSVLIEGAGLADGLSAARGYLAGKGGAAEDLALLLDRARWLAGASAGDRAAIAELGEGWTGEEALAIAAFCALRYQDDGRAALLAAVNHAGDSDSTGSIAGQILGAAYGPEPFPDAWRLALEERERLEALAGELAAVRGRTRADG